MIVASLLLVIVAAVTLVIGLFNPENANWVWTSIGCCLLAGLLLIVGVLRSRPRRKPVLQSGTDQPASWSGASSWSGAESEDATLSRDDAAGIRVIDESAGARGEDTTVIAPASPPGASVADDTGQWAPEPAPEPTVAPASADDAAAQVDLAQPDPWAGTDAEPEAPAMPAAPVAAPAPTVIDGPVDAAAEPGEPVVVPKARAARKPAATTAGMSDADKINAALAGISGVGPTKRTALIETFGTYRKLRAAPVERIAAVPGISRTLAERIHTALHS